MLVGDSRGFKDTSKWLHLPAKFKGPLKSETNAFYFSQPHFSEGGSTSPSTSYKAVPHETNQLDGETASESKEARGYRSHKFPRNSSNNLIKYLLEPWQANGRATTHLYSKHCSVLSLPGKWNHFQKCISHLISSFLLEWLCFAGYLVRSSPGPSPFLSAIRLQSEGIPMQSRKEKEMLPQKTKKEKKWNLKRLKWNRDSCSSLGGSGCGTRLLSAGTWRNPCSDMYPANWHPTVSRRPKPCRCCVSTRRQTCCPATGQKK